MMVLMHVSCYRIRIADRSDIDEKRERRGEEGTGGEGREGGEGERGEEGYLIRHVRDNNRIA